MLILGDSGKGKTNLLCRLAESIRFPCILFSGEFYEHSQFHIRGELESVLKSFRNREGIQFTDPIAEVNSIAKRAGELMLILIDGLNTFMDRAVVWEEITRFVIESNRAYPNLKFCISCRTEGWESLKRRGEAQVPINLMYTSQAEDLLRRRNEGSIQGIRLRGFEGDEIDMAFKHYQEVFNTKGNPNPSTREICTDPLFTRLVFETYQNAILPRRILKREIFDLFWERKIDRGEENKKKFIECFVQYLKSQNKTAALFGSIKGEEWFCSDSLEELVEEGIIISSKVERYETTLRLFHDKFLEYVLARSLYLERDKIRETSSQYLERMRDYEPMKGALYFLLGMIEGRERHEILNISR